MRKINQIQISYIVIGLAIFSYVFIRACCLDITFDEGVTIMGFVSQSWTDILSFTEPSANNHLLNTLLIKLFFLSGNDSLLLARMPNVLAFVMYCYYAYKIGYKFMRGYVGVACFLVLLINPFVLDFFGIARGYGLGLGLQMTSVYYLLNYAKEMNSKYGWISLALGAFAVLSNFSMLNYFVVILFVINALPLLKMFKVNFFKMAAKSLLVVGGLFALIYQPIMILRESDSLYYGGKRDFYLSTLESLSRYTLYVQETSKMVDVFLDIFLITSLIALVVSLFFNRKLITPRNIILLILSLAALSIITQFKYFGTLYLMDRTALLYIPLFIFVLFLSIQDFQVKWYGKAITLIVILGFGINFLNHANLYKTVTWYFNSRTETILHTFNEMGKERNETVKINFSWPFALPIQYYLERGDYPHVEIVKWNPDIDEEYYIHLPRKIDKVHYDPNKPEVLKYEKDIYKEFKSESIVIYTNIKKE